MPNIRVTQERRYTTQNKINVFNIAPYQLFPSVKYMSYLRYHLTHAMNAVCGALKTVTS
jgi:hypothetical protein